MNDSSYFHIKNEGGRDANPYAKVIESRVKTSTGGNRANKIINTRNSVALTSGNNFHSKKRNISTAEVSTRLQHSSKGGQFKNYDTGSQSIINHSEFS